MTLQKAKELLKLRLENVSSYVRGNNELFYLALETVLNELEKCKNCLDLDNEMIDNKDTEINKLKTKNNELLKDKVYLEEENKKAWAKYWNAMKCIDKLNNVIDRMAERMNDLQYEIREDCFIPREYSDINDCAKKDSCKKCIKEYFMKPEQN